MSFAITSSVLLWGDPRKELRVEPHEQQFQNSSNTQNKPIAQCFVKDYNFIINNHKFGGVDRSEE